ncbi:DUF302 domain-containing protein [Loktanella sp. F6476L]|uniref:DUF302 domain-containing protein n=1 Tax=Loktanella sp. F6476L TaxID=2926405 RepID=UPI001FF5B3B4|nr:DUF302 domain-containing protein [Loktanella sp. F6476L]MCK0120512.1 DUF302 domain-containing protein [Loktanella sp. F6476L]
MRLILIAILALWSASAMAQSVTSRDGWVVMDSDKPFDVLLSDLREAVSANQMAVVTQAGPTGAAANRGITIPNNRVVGVFNNLFAVRILNLSTPAMIEAPIRFYLTETEDGAAALSYKTPSFVFAPYVDDADPDLLAAATELDAIFLAIATAAR